MRSVVVEANFSCIASNDEMRKVIADIILKCGKSEEGGPDIWSLAFPRSLVGKDKSSSSKGGKLKAHLVQGPP